MVAVAGVGAGCGPALAAAPAPHGAAPDTTSPGAPSITGFAEIPFIEQAELSPDGTFLAGLFGIAGERRICAMNLFDNTKLHCANIPDGTEPFALRWVNDQNIIVSLQALANVGSAFVTGPDRMYVSRVIGMNWDTGKLTKLLWTLNGQNASDVLWVATDGSPMIELSGQTSIMEGEDFWPVVYRVNVETGHYDKIQRGRDGVIDWAADSRGTVRTGVSYDDRSRTMRLLYRSEQGGELKTIERADTRKREGLIYPVLFLPGTDHALATHDDDSGFSTLYEIDLTTQKDVRSVYAAGERREIAYVQTDAGGTTLLAAGDSGADAHVHWFDSALADLQAQFDKAVGGGAVGRRATIVSLSRDRKRMLVRVDRPDTPGGLYYYNVDAGSMHRIAWYSERLAGRPLAPVSLVHYQARDGLPIEAVLTLPQGFQPKAGLAAKGLPIVMLPHGGPWGQDELSYDYWAQFIASLGYAVLQPNFRGSTGYGTSFLHKGEGQLGLAMQDDITDGLRWAVSQGIADPKRACIVGASYGGYAAMWGIAKDPGLYRCAISIAGVASLRREVNDFGNDLMQNKFTDDWKRMTPDFVAVSPLNAVAAIKAPLLLIHGEKDVTVDVGQSKSMYKRMLAAGKDVQFVDLPLADHHFGREADRKKLLGAMGEFLAKYNPADPVPAQVASAGTGSGVAAH
jgi:dipeptidyl aminopeptidase/acylaminoacyl peptidase